MEKLICETGCGNNLLFKYLQMLSTHFGLFIFGKALELLGCLFLINGRYTSDIFRLNN